MKTFIIALLVLGVMMSGIVAYSLYMKDFEDSLIKMTDNLSKKINEDDWDNSYKEYKKLSQIWEENKKVLAMFNDHGDLDEIELEIVDLNESIVDKDKQHSLKAVNNIKVLLKRLAKNESFSIENILKLSHNVIFCHIM